MNNVRMKNVLESDGG